MRPSINCLIHFYKRFRLKMSTRWYPIYQRGNPQLRVFLPNFWMKLVKPTVVFGKAAVPENKVQLIKIFGRN